MASKSKDVRIEQRRVLEKKLELRLAKLAADGIAKEKVQSDSIVKNLKSKIRETNVRIAAFEKNIKKAQDLAKAKEEKLAAKAAPKAAQAADEKEAKPKKKSADKEGKKPAAAGDAAKKPKKKKEESAA
jgi:hypothetical protein